MFRSKPNPITTSSHCKKHPKHKQSPGVCSLCLTQKLTKLSVSKDSLFGNRRVYSDASSSASSSSSDVSSDVSSCVSPRHTITKTKEKSSFWSNLLMGRKRKSLMRGNGYFHGQFVLSHSEPLPMTTTSTKVLVN